MVCGCAGLGVRMPRCQWGGCARWVPSPASSPAGASPSLQKPAALLPSSAAGMGPALAIQAAATSSSTVRTLRMK